MDDILVTDKYYALWQKFSQTRSAISKAREKRIGKYFHPNWGSALTFIWANNGKATPGMLAKSLFLEHHSASELVNRLEKKGLVKRDKDKAKKRVVRISITEKGREVCFQAMQTDFIVSIISTISDEQRQQLNAILDILYQTARKHLE
jgi:DNA-binding MarR family transcriptional regulator